MSKFLKLFITLLLILLVEIILIYAIHSKKTTADTSNYSVKNKYIIVVDVQDNNLSLFQNGEFLKKYQICGGKPSTPSPLGVWRIVNKDTWGKGFGGHWMGFNVPWGKYGIHGTTHPETIGSSSSQGCIRMKNNEVTELYKIIPHGTPVVVWGGPYGNFGSYLRTVKPGDRGSDVYELQRILMNKGYYSANPSGIYNEYLKNVVHKFQKDNNLPITDEVNYNFYKSLGVKLMD